MTGTGSGAGLALPRPPLASRTVGALPPALHQTRRGPSPGKTLAPSTACPGYGVTGPTHPRSGLLPFSRVHCASDALGSESCPGPRRAPTPEVPSLSHRRLGSPRWQKDAPRLLWMRGAPGPWTEGAQVLEEPQGVGRSRSRPGLQGTRPGIFLRRTASGNSGLGTHIVRIVTAGRESRRQKTFVELHC